MGKTALTQLIEVIENNDPTWLDYHVRIREAAKGLLTLERDQICIAFLEGDLNGDKYDNPSKYYKQKYGDSEGKR